MTGPLGVLQAVAIPVVFFVFLGTLLWLMQRPSGIRHPVEHGLVPIREYVVAGGFDSYHATWPLVQVRIYERFAIIKSLGEPIILEPGDVTGIERVRAMLSEDRIRVTHRRKDLSRKIVLIPVGSSDLDAALRKCLLNEPALSAAEGPSSA